MAKIKFLFVSLLYMSIFSVVYAQEADRITELESKIEALQMELKSIKDAQRRTEEEQKQKTGGLAEEIRKMRLAIAAPEAEYKSYSGMGPAASKVYFKDRGLSIGGYGETFYSNFDHDAKKDFADALRFVLYTGYKWSERIIMNAEIEVEHGGIGNVSPRSPEVYLEFAYLDFLLNPKFNVRSGLILTPMGLINEYHEPTVFHGVLRPDVERFIIPSTWRDIGILAYGNISDFSYKLGILNGLRADIFRSSDWIRAGRQQGAQVKAEGLAGIARLDYMGLLGLTIGGSYYFGEAGQKDRFKEVGEREIEADVDLWEIHADYRFRGLELRGLYTQGNISPNRDFINFQISSKRNVGDEAQGWYLEAAYDVMPLIRPGSIMYLAPFVRYESYNLHDETFPGIKKDRSLERTNTTLGLTFKPYPNVVIKGDFQIRDTEDPSPKKKDREKIDQFNLGIGFIF